MSDKKPESKITHKCDGSVSCVTANQNRNQSAGSARKTSTPTAKVVRGK